MINQLPNPKSSAKVLNVGALLHHVSWKKSIKISRVVENHGNDVRNNYGNCFIVFDGHNNSLLIKSNKHERRRNNRRSCPDIEVHQENESKDNRERFLSNRRNKKQLIAMITDCVLRDGQNVHVCEGDTKIVSTALVISKIQQQPSLLMTLM